MQQMTCVEIYDSFFCPKNIVFRVKKSKKNEDETEYCSILKFDIKLLLY